MKITPARSVAALLALITILFLTATESGRHAAQRIQLASTLIGTFVLFPLSDVTVVPIDEKRMAANGTGANRIPTLVHQVKLGGLEMRPTWVEARQSCLDLHPSWTFTLWEDAEADAFVRERYPHLFDMYRAYPLEIQRSNVLRYLILDQFGGIYLDLDLRCRVALDPLRNETFLTPPANPSGVNNAFIASTPHHAFWRHLEDRLPTYNLGWFRSPYISNMMSTGCHFFSTMHRTFPDQAQLGVLDQANKLNGHVTTPLFEHLGASSWHKGDAKAILRIGQYIEGVKGHPIVAFATLFALVAFATALFGLARRIHGPSKGAAGYMDLEASKEYVVQHG